MKKSLVSILIAGVLFFSNIGMTTFAVERDLESAEASASSQEEQEKEKSEDDISYYKISDFTALPENIALQEVRIGAGIEDIEFPDTLEVKVEPDLDRDERIMRSLAHEREQMRKDREKGEAEAASSASSDYADEASSEGSSIGEDEEEIIFFESDDEASDEASELSGEEENEDGNAEEEYSEEITDDIPSSGNTIVNQVNPAPEVPSEEPVTEEEPPLDQDESELPGEEGGNGDDSGNDSTPNDEGSVEETGTQSAEEGLIGWFSGAFKGIIVHAAENEKNEDSADENKEPEVSIERISEVEWILEPQYNDGIDFFSPDYDGQVFLFTPVLILPDNYYIEDELPIITVTVSQDYFPFDEAVEVDGVTIRVRADKGVFPEGATVSASKLIEEDEEKIQAVFEEQTDVDPANIVKQYTFDITVHDRDGNEVEPDTEKGSVFVSFETEEVSDVNLVAEIYHFVESESTSDDAEVEDSDEAKEISDGETSDDSQGESESEEDATDDEAAVLGGEREISIYGEDVDLVVEKLDAVVVDGEEGQALEAETHSFSTYTLLFKLSNSITAEIENSAISLEQLFDKTYGNGTVTGVTFDTNAYDKYIYAEILNYYTDTSGTHVPQADTDTGGLYKKGTFAEGSYEYFLVIKRPFKTIQSGISIEVSYTTAAGTTQYSVTVKDASSAEPQMGNYSYPTASELDAKKFTLEMPISSVNGGVIYQWEKRANGATSWEDIDYANSPTFSNENDSGFAYEGYWLRCTVNGTPSNEVQILTPDGDTSRVWAVPNTLNNQCYVGNGQIAYTRIKESDTKEKFDVVGEFLDGTTRKMMSTTVDGEGWKIFSNLNTDDASSIVWTGDSYHMDHMYFAFSGDSKLHIIAQTNMAGNYDKFAIGARCQVGTASSDYSEAKVDTSKRLTNMSVVDGTRDSAQKEVNNGTDGVCSVVITPGSTKPTYFLGASSAIKPYHDSTSSSSATEYSDSSIGVALGWTGLTGKVEFDIAVGGVTSTEALVPVSKTGDSRSYTLNSNVKTLKLSSDSPLTAYAKSDQAGGVNETVKIELRFASGSSTGKTSISNVLPTYTKPTSTTSTTTTTTTTSSSSSGSTAYSADYFDVNVKNYKNGSTSGIVVDEINDNVVIEINYNFDSKEDIKVYRDHDGASELKQDSSGAEGTCKVDKDKGKIYIYTKKFSTYAVAYKPVTYYTVTFKDGTNTNTVKVKAGDKVARPDDPVKEGYIFMGWFKAGTSTVSTPATTTTASTTAKVTTSDAFDFDTPITANITLNAGWTSTKATAGTGEDGDVNGARAPQTSDSLPIVWLWVLVLIGGVGSFGYAFYERYRANGGDGSGKSMNKVKRTILLIGIVVSTLVKFLIKKIKHHKYECMLAASAVLILISVGTLVSTYLEYHKSEEIYIDVNDEYVNEAGEAVQELAETENEANEQADEGDWWKDVTVDVAGLSEEYPDVVGWIYFENEDISYPIMYSGDNSKYLSTAYTGKKARAGAIFIDGESTPDFSDPHSLVYGHNMRDLSMFGRLRYYKTDANYYDEHQYFQVFTKDGVYRYQIFAYEEVPDNHDVFWVYGEEPEGMEKMLKEIEQDSYRKTGIEATENDHVITLATCTSQEDKRLIVSAVRTDEHLLASR